MNPTADDRLLGEYRLKELVAENEFTRTWLADQLSISRRVLVDELLPGHDHHREQFLADVRAKAAVEHPLIGSVYEAVAEPGRCFFAHELLPGATLADRLKAGEPFKPAQLVHILRRIAEGHLHHQSLGQPTEPLDPRHIHIDTHGVIRLDNLARAGERTAEESVRDVVGLGEALVPLVADCEPGTTRMLTLFGWMRGEGLDEPITWQHVRDFTLQIEQQLADPPTTLPTPGKHPRKKPPVAVITIAGALALLVVLGLALRMRPSSTPPPQVATPPESVLVEAGSHATPDGPEESLPAFRIFAHEVTIGQYASFLETLAMLAENQREHSFDHIHQPAEKLSHVPDDWQALFAAAKAGGIWNDRPVTLHHAVVGVDWWDAAAYAEWKKARLPSQEEWFAALTSEVEEPGKLPPAPWIAVTARTADRTPRGIIGLAGSVCEWTRNPAVNPLNPLGQPQWVIIGGSHLKPGTNALTREWVDDRSLRRPDLGFRIVTE